jgi:hypothetical protein
VLSLALQVWASGGRNRPLDTSGLDEEGKIKVRLRPFRRCGVGPVPECECAAAGFLMVEICSVVRRPSENVKDFKPISKPTNV